MGRIVDAARKELRDHNLPGVPASGAYAPRKAGLRSGVFEVIEAEVVGARAMAENAAFGIRWVNQAVRVRATANVSIANGLENGDALNDVVLETGDVVFLPYQDVASENGLYVVQAAGAAVRAGFADAAADLARIGFLISEGAVGAGERWTLPLAAADINVGATALVFARVGIEVDYAGAVNEHLDGLSAQLDKFAVPTLSVEYSGISVMYPATLINPIERGPPFTGWGVAFPRPAALAFNAISLAVLARQPGLDPEQRWQRIRVFVLTHGVNAAGGESEVVAVGEVRVRPEDDRLYNLIVPMRDPATGALITVTQADLDADFFVGYQALSGGEGETLAVTGEASADRAGLAFRDKYYITEGDGRVEPWSLSDGGTDLLIDFLLLDDLTVEDSVSIASDFAERYALPGVGMVRPGPNEPVLAPRHFCLRGYDAKLFFWGACSGLGPKLFDVRSGDGVGRHDDGLWRYVAPQGINLEGQPLVLTTLHSDFLSQLGRAETDLWMLPADAAGGAPLRVLAIGDSMTAASFYIQRVIALAAANAGGVQPTFMGTLGAGAAKHEGRPGWTVDYFFETEEAGANTNAFITAPGGKFNAGGYLAATAQAQPDVVTWLLGANDVFSATSDLEANLTMSTYLDRLDRMIGRTVDAAVGSWKEVDPAIRHLIGTPIPPANTQTGFGSSYGIGQTMARYKRNMAIAAYRIIKHFEGAEAEGIFIVPYHLAIDGVAGFDGAVDALHPNVAGYNQMGDQLYFALNVLSAEGLI